ncbi:hypothetical protein CROQUDRAFT_666253 [Cronartium quercuum f. sp. fusiforme G11]|uniref:Uncharacterized protein n=1 Tax=Cronartium quercuum f. sp. fusiforme G11 TaxID=708437 RepID=A0A9P6T6N7_9BASI|nr:hypothetical protein CROQUDRAFT_666253 [Cronartium quercuum f. sp. fusiforme G11]
MCSTDPDLQHLKFTLQEWEGLSQFHNFLKPFSVFTSKLYGSDNTFHNATPAYEMMIAGLTKAYDQLDTHPAIKIAIQPMMDKLLLYRDATLRKPVYLECAFSAGGWICDNLQGSLKAGTIAAQVCLKSWLNCFDSSGI